MNWFLFTACADRSKAVYSFAYYMKEDNKMIASVFQIKVNKMPLWCIV